MVRAGLSPPRPDIMEEARGRWPSILSRLGIPAKALTGKHGPCPMCGGKDRFRFTDWKQNGTFICNQCGSGSGIKLLMAVHGWDFRTAAAEVRKIVPTAIKTAPGSSGQGAIDWLVNRTWGEAHDLAGTMADDYLTDRGLPGVRSAALRFHPSAMLSDVPGRSACPAMLAAVSGPDGELATLHRTYLDGPRKADLWDYERKRVSPRKLMPGDLRPGSAIRLSPCADVLAVAEGIETALAVERWSRLPTWATINSSMLAKFVPPKGLRRLVIFGDNDPKFGGQAAAWELAHRQAVRPNAPEIIVHIPAKTGEDWLDVWCAR